MVGCNFSPVFEIVQLWEPMMTRAYVAEVDKYGVNSCNDGSITQPVKQEFTLCLSYMQRCWPVNPK